MIEKTKAISNPLTIVAIFAALAEVSGTVALSAVDKELQHVFIWFVMLFPTFLVAVFFLTLNFNPKVLYAPGDFSDENNFVNMINKTDLASKELGDIARDIESTREELLESVSRFHTDNEIEKKKIEQLIDKKLRFARGNVALQQGNLSSVVKTFKDPRIGDDIRKWPNSWPCPKCGDEMGLTEQGDYHCHTCNDFK